MTLDPKRFSTPSIIKAYQLAKDAYVFGYPLVLMGEKDLMGRGWVMAACLWAEIVHRGGTRADLERLRENPAFAIEEPAWAFNESTLKGNVTHWPSAWLKRVS